MKKTTAIIKKTSRGRPSKYDPKYCEQARKLCLLGATDKELSDFFEINEDTLNEWKKVYPEFSESLKQGKVVADANVSNSLYHRAIGYDHSDVDIKIYKGSIIKTELVKHYPPDTIAAIFWLKNRGKNKWTEKQIVDHQSKGKRIEGFNYVKPNGTDQTDNQTDTKATPSV